MNYASDVILNIMTIREKNSIILPWLDFIALFSFTMTASIRPSIPKHISRPSKHRKATEKRFDHPSFLWTHLNTHDIIGYILHDGELFLAEPSTIIFPTILYQVFNIIWLRVL